MKEKKLFLAILAVALVLGMTACPSDGDSGEASKTSAVSVTGVSLNKTTTSLVVGGTETLFANIDPSNATNKNVTWKSSNTAVATVSEGGVVTGVSAGTVTITVTAVDGGKTASCTVPSVIPPFL